MRKTGYYWIRCCTEDDLEIAYFEKSIFNGEFWTRIGDRKHYCDQDFAEIYESDIESPSPNVKGIPGFIEIKSIDYIQRTTLSNLHNPTNPK